MTTDPSDLRQRIAEALYVHDHPIHVVPLNETGMGAAYRESADAVLAVLPPPADRAAVLRDLVHKAEEWDGHITVQELRRLADEAQPEPPVHGESVAHLAGLHDDEPAVDARQDGAQQ